MDFDIRTKDAAWHFVLDMLHMTAHQLIKSYIEEWNKDFEAFWCAHRGHIDSVDIEPLRVCAFHVTGSIDDCASYKRLGLLNLQQAISMGTPLKRMLDKYGLHIDLNSKTMEYCGDVINIDYE